jgi:hypothetical protein
MTKLRPFSGITLPEVAGRIVLSPVRAAAAPSAAFMTAEIAVFSVTPKIRDGITPAIPLFIEYPKPGTILPSGHWAERQGTPVACDRVLPWPETLEKDDTFFQ